MVSLSLGILTISAMWYFYTIKVIKKEKD